MKILITTSVHSTTSKAVRASPKNVALWKDAVQSKISNFTETEVCKPFKENSINMLDTFPTHIVLKIIRDNSGFPHQFTAGVVAGGKYLDT